jgi:hypothetical protein
MADASGAALEPASDTGPEGMRLVTGLTDSQEAAVVGAEPLTGLTGSVRDQIIRSGTPSDGCQLVDLERELSGTAHSPSMNQNTQEAARDAILAMGEDEEDDPVAAVETTTTAMVQLTEALAAQAAASQGGPSDALEIIRSEVNGVLLASDNGNAARGIPRSPEYPPGPPTARLSVPRGILRKILSYLLGCHVLKNTIIPALLVAGKGAFKLTPTLLNVTAQAGTAAVAAAVSMPSATGTVVASFGIAPWIVVMLGLGGLGALGLEIYGVYNSQPEAVIGNVEKHREFIRALHKIGNHARARELRGLADQIASSQALATKKMEAYMDLKLAVTELADNQEADITEKLQDIWKSIAASGPVGEALNNLIGKVGTWNDLVAELGKTIYFVPIDALLKWLDADDRGVRAELLGELKLRATAALALHPYPPTQALAVGVMAGNLAMRTARDSLNVAAGAGGEIYTQAVGLCERYFDAYKSSQDGNAVDLQALRNPARARANTSQGLGVAGAKGAVAAASNLFSPYSPRSSGGAVHGLRKKRRTKKKASIKSTRKKSARKSPRKKSARKSKGSKRTYRRKPTLRKTRGVKENLENKINRRENKILKLS